MRSPYFIDDLSDEYIAQILLMPPFLASVVTHLMCPLYSFLWGSTNTQLHSYVFQLVNYIVI